MNQTMIQHWGVKTVIFLQYFPLWIATVALIALGMRMIRALMINLSNNFVDTKKFCMITPQSTWKSGKIRGWQHWTIKREALRHLVSFKSTVMIKVQEDTPSTKSSTSSTLPLETDSSGTSFGSLASLLLESSVTETKPATTHTSHSEELTNNINEQDFDYNHNN